MHGLIVVERLLSQIICQGASLYRLLGDIDYIELRQQNLPSGDTPCQSRLLKDVLDRVHFGYQPSGMAQHVLS